MASQEAKRKRAPREKIPAKVARQRFTELMNRAGHHGERIVVTFNGKDHVAIIGMQDLSLLDGAA